MFRAPFFVAVSLAIAFAGGIWSSLAVIDADEAIDVVRIGPWEATPRAQTIAANPYAKARRAREGAFPLGQAEGLVFRARTDSSGEPLRGSCSYSIIGQTPASRMWTLQLTDPAGAVLRGEPALPAALHSYVLQRRPDGSFVIRLDADARSGNWIHLDRVGPFAVKLTLFDTPAAGNFGLIDLTMPEIRREGCADA